MHTGDGLAMAVVVERDMRLGGDVALSFPPTEDEKCAFWIGLIGFVCGQALPWTSPFKNSETFWNMSRVACLIASPPPPSGSTAAMSQLMNE